MLTNMDGEHSIDLDLITPGGWAIDVGCRGFAFSNRLVERGLRVIAVDPDRDVTDPNVSGLTFRRVGIVDDPAIGTLPYCAWSYGDGNHLVYGRKETRHQCVLMYDVPCTTIPKLMAEFGIARFEVAKFDCEGAEYKLLSTWPGPIAKQITVEFHDFLGVNPCPDDPERYYNSLKAHLGQWYDVTSHAKTTRGNLTAYWDSVFTLKPAILAAG